jgi:hypothetical protein
MHTYILLLLSPFSHKIYIKTNIIAAKTTMSETTGGTSVNSPLLPPPTQGPVIAGAGQAVEKENPKTGSFDVSALQVWIFIFSTFYISLILFLQINYSIKELLNEMRNDHKEIIKEMRQDTRWMTWIGIFMTLATLILAAAIFWHGFWAKST